MEEGCLFLRVTSLVLVLYIITVFLEELPRGTLSVCNYIALLKLSYKLLHSTHRANSDETSAKQDGQTHAA
jgi:hypothetical protein